MSNEKISLYFTEGSSDKEYHAELVEKDGGYLVNFRYGRRGAALTSGTKTTTALPLAKAKVIYDKLVKEKTSKGYSTGVAGNAYQDSALEERVSGLLPQLLNAIDEVELERLLDSPAHALEEKIDGKRVLIRRAETSVEGANRRGLVIALPKAVADAATQLDAGTVLDGELVGEVFFAFDCLEFRNKNLRNEGYFTRSVAASHAINTAKLGVTSAIRAIPRYEDSNKRVAFAKIKAAHGEGVVFKLMSAPYTVGRPASGGSALKYKFTESATCRVAGQNTKGKRSVSLELLDDAGNWVGVGNVTIPPNFTKVPSAGVLVEVEYLYAYRGGALFQPVFKGLRDDQTEARCILSQLKYKPESSEDEEA